MAAPTNWTERLASMTHMDMDTLDDFFLEHREVAGVRDFARNRMQAREAFLYTATDPIVGKCMVKILNLPLHRPNAGVNHPEIEAHEILAGCPCAAVAFRFLNILGLPAIVTNYYDADDAMEVMENEGPFDEREAQKIGSRVLHALAHLHGIGFVHRDVKPENIFLYYVDDVLSESGRSGVDAVLGDFEFTVPVDDPGIYDPKKNTAIYAAPEVLRGERFTEASDMWSFGVTLYVLLHKRHPFWGHDLASWVQSIKWGDRVGYSDHISEEARDVIDRLLVQDPAQRLTAEQALAHPFFDLPVGKEL